MKGFLFACLAVAAFAVPGSIANALDNSFLLQEEPTPPIPTGITSGGGSVSYAPRPGFLPGRGTQWKTAKASWYTMGKKTADGTRMRRDGAWVATRLVPLGKSIEIRNKAGKVFRFVVRDTPAKKFGHRIDIPQATWQDVTGAKLSTGLVALEWRACE